MAREGKIQKLTAAQEDALRESVESWLAVGYSTERCDRTACEDAWAGLYAKLGEGRPTVLWFDSPLACILAWGILSQLDSQLDSQLRSQLGSQLYSQLGSQLDSQLRSQLDSQLGSQLGSQLYSQLDSQLYSQLGSQLDSQLRSQLGSQLYSQLRSQLDVRWGGGWWSSWPAFYTWPEIHLADQGFSYDTESSSSLDLWRKDAENSHSWFPYKGLILASDRPTIIAVDEEGRPHRETGPALQYADSYSLYAWHGVRLDDPRVIEKPEALTADEVLGQENAEVRRVMIERFGYDRLLSETNAELLDADVDATGRPRELRRIALRGDEPLTLVRVVNSSAEPDGSFKEYLLRVDPSCRPMHDDGSFGRPQELTCQNAIASTFGLTGAQYEPAIQT